MVTLVSPLTEREGEISMLDGAVVHEVAVEVVVVVLLRVVRDDAEGAAAGRR